MNAPVKGGQYNFSTHNRALKRLPPKAIEKLGVLRESAMRAQAMRDGLASAMNTIRENYDEARTDLARFDREWGATVTVIEEVGDPDEYGNKKRVRVERDNPDRVPIVERVTRLRADLQKVSDQLNDLVAGFNVDTVLDEIGRMSGKFVPVSPPKITERGSPKEMLKSLREKQRALEADIEETRTLPITVAEAKERARGEIETLAAKGMPDATPLFHNGGTIAFPEQMIISSAMGHAPTTVVSTQRDGFALTVALLKDQLLKVIDEQLEAEGDGVTALSAEDRKAKLATMERNLTNLYRMEEALICRLEDEGAQLVPRQNTDALILLEIEHIPE